MQVDAKTGLYHQSMKWRKSGNPGYCHSVTSTSGPLLSTAPTALGSGPTAVGPTSARTATAQGSLFGLSDPPDPPSAAPSKRVAA